MAGLQDHLRLRQVGRGAPQFADQIEQTLDTGEHTQNSSSGVDVFLRDAQVFELADGVVGRQASVNFFSASSRAYQSLLVLAQQGPGPRSRVCLAGIGAGVEHAAHEGADLFVQG